MVMDQKNYLPFVHSLITPMQNAHMTFYQNLRYSKRETTSVFKCHH